MGERDSVGDRIRERREALGLTQRELSLRVGYTRSSISQIETGAQIPPTRALGTLAAALGCSTGFLLGEDDAGPPGEEAAYRQGFTDGYAAARRDVLLAVEAMEPK